MESLDKQDGDEVFWATETCRKSLEGCCKEHSLIDKIWAENRLADFNLWSAGVGASASLHASLDWRLRFHQDTKLVFLRLLSTLENCAERCKELGKKQDLGAAIVSTSTEHVNSESSSEADPLELDEVMDANSSWGIDASVLSKGALDNLSERTSPETPLAEAMRDTELILDQLIKLGFAICQSGTTARLQKADRSFNPDSQADFRAYLAHVLLAQVTEQEQLGNTKKVEVGDTSTKRRKVGDTSTKRRIYYGSLDLLDSVQLKLIEANARRRHRFNYAKRHAGRLADQRRVLPNVPDLRRETPRMTESRENPTPSAFQEHGKMQSLPDNGAPSQNTITTATEVKEQFDPKLSTTAPSQRDNTVVSTTIQKLVYPRPPLRADGTRPFTCPCCFQTLSGEQAQKNSWRKHLASDLCPYTCPFPDCKVPDILYITKETWKTHILEDHTSSSYWECPACKNMDNVGKFQTAKSFIEHIRVHGNPMPEEQIDQFAELCLKKELPLIGVCPLCKPTNEVSASNLEATLDHLGEHIHDFSLLSLPWAKDSVRPSTKPSEYKIKFVEAWLSRMDLSKTASDAEVSAQPLHFTAEKPGSSASDDTGIDSENYFAGESDESGSNIALREFHSSSGNDGADSWLSDVSDDRLQQENPSIGHFEQSDRPQTSVSHITGWQMQNPVMPGFEYDDEVQIVKGPNGNPIKLIVVAHRWKDEEYQYKLKDKDGNIFSEMQGKEEVFWVSEDRLELAW